MKILTALILALFISAADAQPPNRPNHRQKPVIGETARDFTNNYYRKHATRFNDQFWYYKGWKHNHWSKVVFSNRYGTYLYFDPHLRNWYYWCQPRYAFFPVSYAPFGYVFPLDQYPPRRTSCPGCKECGCGPECTCDR